MSITDHPSDFVPPRHRQPPRLVEQPPQAPDPIQTDMVAQLREIAEAQGFKLVPADATPEPDKNDIQYVANSLDALRYLDLKQVAKDMLGEAKPSTPAEFADLMAEWAATNKTKVPS